MTERTAQDISINSIELSVDGVRVRVAPGATVAAAVLTVDARTRTSVSGEPRAPLCGMGICFECQVGIDGVPYQRSCQILCSPGMRVTTCGEPSLP
jgi:sarcosine oxidase subunit alpha